MTNSVSIVQCTENAGQEDGKGLEERGGSSRHKLDLACLTFKNHSNTQGNVASHHARSDGPRQTGVHLRGWRWKLSVPDLKRATGPRQLARGARNASVLRRELLLETSKHGAQGLHRDERAAQGGADQAILL